MEPVGCLLSASWGSAGHTALTLEEAGAHRFAHPSSRLQAMPSPLVIQPDTCCRKQGRVKIPLAGTCFLFLLRASCSFQHHSTISSPAQGVSCVHPVEARGLSHLTGPEAVPEPSQKPSKCPPWGFGLGNEREADSSHVWGFNLSIHGLCTAMMPCRLESRESWLRARGRVMWTRGVKRGEREKTVPDLMASVSGASPS